MSEFARNLAVVLGINQYDGGIAPLQTATNDATALAQILKEKHNYQVRLWVDKQATLTNLNHLLEELLPKTVTEGDRLLFYFAGHGIALNGENGPEGYLIPQDARLGKVESYLPMSELNQALAKLPCRHFLAVLDCCFAGAFRWSSNRDVSTVPEVIHKERYDRFIQDPAWQVITSAAHDQKALDILTLRDRTDSTNNHSPFATALMNALAGEADSSPPAREGKPAGDGVITATELYLYLRDAVERNTENSAKRQTPGLWCLKNHDKGEYIFLTPGHKLNLPPAPPLDVSKNPYRGLASFEEEHSNLFFGRSALTSRLQEFVAQHLLIVVLGASGSGKSSLVKAGLIPCLKQLLQTQETQEQWKILGPVRPGESPITALQSALKDSISPLADVLTQGVEVDEKTLVSGIANWKQQHPDTKLLLVIDQFEELVTLCRDEVQREQFLKLLAHALNSCSEQLHLLLTLRSDFEPQFRDTPLEDYWKEARFVVAAMTREELREAIEEPASLRVMHFEPHNLVDQLIDEVAQMPGALPLLSFALSELYLKYLQRQDKARNRGETIDRAITQADYDELGGVTRSLTQRADQEYEVLVRQDSAYTQTIRNVMLRMIALGGELARRHVPLSELRYPEPNNQKIKEVIQRFSTARLLTIGVDTDEQPYVEPAHDVLIRGWQRLLEWRQENLATLLLQQEITLDATKWAKSRGRKQAQGFLWDNDPRLPLALSIDTSSTTSGGAQFFSALLQTLGIKFLPFQKNLQIKDSNTQLNLLELEFIQASFTQRVRRLRNIIGIAVAVIVSLLMLTGWALVESENSQVRAAAASSEALLASNQPLEALLKATEAGRRLGQPLAAISAKADTRIRTAIALQQALYGLRERIRLEGNVGNINDVAFSPNGETIASVSGDGTVRFWNLDGSQPKVFWGHTEPVHNINFSPDAQLIVTAADFETILWNSDGKKIKVLPGGYFGDAIFSHSGQLIAVATDGEDKDENGVAYSVVKILDRNGQEIKTLEGFADQVRGFSFNPDDKVLAVASGNTVKLQNLSNGQVKSLEGHSNYVTSVSFSSDGQLLASSSEDGKVKLWNQQGALIKTLEGHQDSVWEVNFSPDGQTIASSGNDGTIRIWNRSGALVETINPQIGAVKSVAFSPDGQAIVVGGWMKIKILNLSGQGVRTLDRYNDETRRIIIARYNGFLDSISSVSFSPDGQTIASTSGHNIRIWNPNGILLESFSYSDNDVTSPSPDLISFSPDGKTLAASIGDCQGVSAIWKSDGTLLGKIKEHTQNFDGCSINSQGFSFSPNGKIIASAMTDANAEKDAQTLSTFEVVRLWNLDGTLIRTFDIGDSNVSGIFFSPDSKTIAIAEDDGEVKLWSLNGRILKTLPTHTGRASVIAFSPDATMIASTGSENTIKISDRNGSLLANIQEPSNAIAFSPDNQMLVSVNQDGYVRLWNKDGTLVKTLLEHSSGFSSLSFSPSGKTLALGSDDGTIVLLNLNLSDLLSRSCAWLHDYLTNVPSAQNQQHLCDGIKPSPQQLIEQGQNLAKQGNIAAATIKLQEALTLDPSLKFNTDIEARRFAVQYFVGQSNGFLSGDKLDQAVTKLTQALELDPHLDLDPEGKRVQQTLAQVQTQMQIERPFNLLNEGKIEEAVAALEDVQKQNPSSQNVNDPETFNTFCWLGSLHGKPAKVMFACEKAIALAPEDGHIRDSRALARALTGDISGAIEDFQTFIEWTDNEKQKAQRQRWVVALRAGENPFTDKELETLLNQ